MIPRLAPLAATLILAGGLAAPAQEATPLPAPVAESDSYDPTLSAKEAVLANWSLAVSGIRAGRVVGDKVVELADEEVDFAILSEQARFALKTMVLRYNSAHWLFATSGELAPADGALLLAAARAAEAVCTDADCAQEIAAIESSFDAISEALEQAATGAATAAEQRKDKVDRVLMAEILTKMSAYLEGGAWYGGLNLSEIGRDGQEISARIVGALAIWGNIEPYVGLVDAEIDSAINDAVDTLLRALRRHTRRSAPLAPDGPEIAAIRPAAEALAGEFARAASLFGN